MTSPISGDTVAQYLRDNPSFFDVHAELLASVTVPHPHGGRAVSLVERQVDVLREKHKVLEMRLADLIRIGRENDAIGERLQRWTRDLLRERDLRRLPAIVTDGLAVGFSVPQVALRLWRLPEEAVEVATAAASAPHPRPPRTCLRPPPIRPGRRRPRERLPRRWQPRRRQGWSACQGW